jgi:hypothetical protein
MMGFCPSASKEVDTPSEVETALAGQQFVKYSP